MDRRMATLVMAVTLVMTSAAAVADDLTGHDRFLCSIGDVTMCNANWECETASPSWFNIPDFIEVDLDAGLLETTKASRENRQTPILHVTREDGLIVLQGLEMGRAFSFNIEESTGVLTAAAARPGGFTGGFGVCTPIPVTND